MVVKAVLASIPADAIDVLEVGCADGAVTLPLVRRGARVLAVDVSAPMTTRLREQAARERLDNLAIVTAPIEELELQPASLDAVVSNYVLHHLRDKDKVSFICRAASWLRPGGCLVIGDMMFGRGGSRRDRRIIRGKVVTLARKGPGGWWRIVKNSVRMLLRVQERALPIGTWMCLLEEAGFTEVTARSVVAEAGVVTGVLPARSAPDPIAAPGTDLAGGTPRPGAAPERPRARRGG